MHKVVVGTVGRNANLRSRVLSEVAARSNGLKYPGRHHGGIAQWTWPRRPLARLKDIVPSVHATNDVGLRRRRRRWGSCSRPGKAVVQEDLRLTVPGAAGKRNRRRNT